MPKKANHQNRSGAWSVRRIKKNDDWMRNAYACIALLLFVTAGAYLILHFPSQSSQKTPTEPSEHAQEGLIRVVLSATGFSDIYHENVQISAQSDFTVSADDTRITYQAGEVWDAAAFFQETEAGVDQLFQSADADTTPKQLCTIFTDDGGGLQLLSITRANGQPVYDGTLDVYRTQNGYVLVNELPVETYLRYVVPSEMPHTYGAEALKAQAVCARSFAWQHMSNPGYPQLDADLDDSIRFQVYNNGGTAEETDAAIAETAGQVLMYEGALAAAYYYSTSWGYTTDLSLWGGESRPYYVSHRQGDGEQSIDLTDEKEFARVLADGRDAYESAEPWYRWETTIPVSRITENLKKYADIEITDLSDIVISGRRCGGSVSELLLMADGKPLVLAKESDIRNCLLPETEDIIRNDGSILHGYEKLPSTFFLIEKHFDNGKLSAVTVRGGGCGHGVGMSQNCAKALAQRGMDYRQLLDYFYPGTYLDEMDGL